jgi:tetratricopeptide (TPR) repeat protein
VRSLTSDPRRRAAGGGRLGRWGGAARAGALLSLAAALLLAAGPLSAAPARAADDTTRAKLKLQEGARALDEGDYEQALARFQEAFALVPSPKIHFNFGLAYLGLARPVDALESFEKFLEEARTATPATRLEAERHVASLKPRVATVSVGCDVDGAEVRVDGKKLGTTPLDKKFYVQAGSHQLLVRRGHAAPFILDFTAAEGGDLRLAATLVMPAANVSPTLRSKPANKPAAPTLINGPAGEPAAEPRSSNRWLIWGTAGGVAVAAAVVLFVVLGGSTSYPKADAMILVR